MTEEVKKRIEDINNGIVPEGYKKTKFGIIPNDWKETQLKNCLKRVSRPVDVDSDTIYKQIGIRSHGKGIFYKEDVTGKELGNKSVFWIEPDCFILNIVFAWEQAIGKTTENEVGMIASHRFPMYKTINTDTDFLISYLLTKKGTELLEDASPGGAGRNKTLGQEAFLKSKVFFPDLAEQNKIARILSTQDEIILYQEQKVEELKNLKRAYLTKMFPQKGSKYPEIRFKGFTDAWEQRKLKEVCSEFQSGKSIKSSEIYETGEYKVYGGNGLRGYTNTYNHDGDYALIGRQGALCGNMNYSTGKAYFTEHAVAVQGNESNDTLFLYYLLDQMNLGQYSGQSAQPGLAVNKIIELKNYFPNLEEQKKIGAYFAELDTTISLHQRKLEAEKKKKKALMQLLLTGKVRVKV